MRAVQRQAPTTRAAARRRSLPHASGLIAACAVLLAAAGPAVARSPAGVDDLRPAYATPVEIREGQQAAAAHCSRCHGTGGVSPAADTPHLAGQRPSYLYAKARAYRSGALANDAMGPAVRHLSDDALVKIAAHYASLDPAGPATSTKKPALPDPYGAGRVAAAGCSGCHGEDGVGTMPGMPNLTGLDPQYLAAAMDAYRSGRRKHDAMIALAAAASERDVRHMALYYALQKPRPAATLPAGNAAAGKAASAACAGCHGETGVSASAANPSLAGQDAEYFVAAMRAYRAGDREDATMKSAAEGLSDAALADLAAYYAAQRPQAPKVVRPLSLAEWAQRCDRCHGVNGNSTDPRMPAIAAQRPDYLQKVLQAYQRGERGRSPMAAMSGALGDAEVAALAAHYASQRARPFVFVMVPAR